MAAMNVRLLAWSLRRHLSISAQRLGLAGCVLGLLAPLLAIAFALDTHLRAELAREQAAHLQVQASLAKQTQPVAVSLEQELRLFEARLPAAEDRMQVLADLFGVAEKHHLVLSRGEYQVEADHESGFTRFKIILPIKGDPAVIGRFIQEALAANPSLAFEALALKRESLNHETVEAKVQLVLFTRAFRAARPSNAPDAPRRSS